MTIIRGETQLREFIERWKVEDSFVEYVLADSERHPMNTSLSLILVKFIEHGDVFVIPINHNEAVNVPIESLLLLRNDNTSTKFVINKKKIKQSFDLVGSVVDISLSKYLMDGSLIDSDICLTESHNHINRIHNGKPNLNTAIPILKWVEWFEALFIGVKAYFVGDVNKFYNTKFIQTISDIEQNGMFVDPSLFTGNPKDISSRGLVFTEYNPFTSTGRPSNRFGGVNFSALPKADGTRSAYTSRFGDAGELVMFDYASYHPHLVAHLIKFPLPDVDIYQWLGMQYLEVETLTAEELAFAKTETFRQFYGGIDVKLSQRVPYLRKIDMFVNRLWDFGSVKGYIPSPISGRRIYLDLITDITKQKLFNYLLQLYETEMNILVMSRVNSILKPLRSKLILYTYDAFLFDVNMEENLNHELITRILTELNPTKKFPLRTYVGETYDNMTQIDTGI
jgi:hypothetical protein